MTNIKHGVTLSIVMMIVGIGNKKRIDRCIKVKIAGNRVDFIWLTTIQFIIGRLFMTVIGSKAEIWSSIVWSVPCLLDLAFIFVFIIAAGRLAFFHLVNSGDASKVASYTFFIPLVALVTSVLFFNEPFTIYPLIGLILIVMSIALVNAKPKSLRKSINARANHAKL